MQIRPPYIGIETMCAFCSTCCEQVLGSMRVEVIPFALVHTTEDLCLLFGTVARALYSLYQQLFVLFVHRRFWKSIRMQSVRVVGPHSARFASSACKGGIVYSNVCVLIGENVKLRVFRSPACFCNGFAMRSADPGAG